MKLLSRSYLGVTLLLTSTLLLSTTALALPALEPSDNKQTVVPSSGETNEPMLLPEPKARELNHMFSFFISGFKTQISLLVDQLEVTQEVAGTQRDNSEERPTILQGDAVRTMIVETSKQAALGIFDVEEIKAIPIPYRWNPSSKTAVVQNDSELIHFLRDLYNALADTMNREFHKSPVVNTEHVEFWANKLEKLGWIMALTPSYLATSEQRAKLETGQITKFTDQCKMYLKELLSKNKR